MRVVEKELRHLRYSSNKVFAQKISIHTIETLDNSPEFAEALEAYASRFCRLQDTLGDKLLPAWLEALGEPKRSVVDNLDKAAQLGIPVNGDDWLVARELRNKMVHEYIESAEVFLNALEVAHTFEALLFEFAQAILEDLKQRGIR